MQVITITAGSTATPLMAASVTPDKLAPFQTLVVAASAAAFMGDSKVSSANGIPIGTTPLVIPANNLQFASDLNEIYFSGSGSPKVSVMVF